MSIDGFYSAYLSAKMGASMALLVFDRGNVAGVDAFGTSYDGTYSQSDWGGSVDANIRIFVPPNGSLLQGPAVGPNGLSYDLPVRLPPDFLDRDFLRIETPYGPVNARFQKLRGIQSES
jgi:hypothetical protein